MKKIFALLSLLALLVACSGESSSSAPVPIGEISSSSDEEPGSSSSVSEKNSSSSVSGKNSSSSVVESSSSELFFHRCDDGDTTIDEAFGEYIYETCRGGFWEADSTKSKRVVDSLAAIEKNKEHPNMDSLFAGYSGEYLEFKGRDTFYVMAENLNYGKMVLGGTTEFDDNVTEKLCYVDDEWFCDNHFGGLYTWAEAMNLPKVCDSVAVDSNDACKSFANAVKSVSDPRVVRWQGICPDGWHIMNLYEWGHTTESSGSLRSKAVWEDYKGSNTSGMSLIPAGVWNNAYQEFWYARTNLGIWQPKAEDVYGWAILMSANSYSFDYADGKIRRLDGRSVRCVMDANNTLTH